MLIFIFYVWFFELVAELAVCSSVVSGVCSLYHFNSIVLASKTSYVLPDTKILLQILIRNSSIFFLVEALRYNRIFFSLFGVMY